MVRKILSRMMLALVAFLLAFHGQPLIGDEEPPPADQPIAAEGAPEPYADPRVQYQADTTAQAGSTESVTPSSLDAREEEISTRVRALVKKLNANDRKEVAYPSKKIAAGLRAEFMRRTEGGTGVPWLRNTAGEGDRGAALDNMELFLTYAEKLMQLAPKGKKASDPKEQLEARLLACKAVIDQYNSAKRGDRTPASANFTFNEGLSKAGKSELQRRKKLLANMVAGPDYKPITVKKVDEFAKKYRQALLDSANEYEKFAALMGTEVSKSGKKKR